MFILPIYVTGAFYTSNNNIYQRQFISHDDPPCYSLSSPYQPRFLTDPLRHPPIGLLPFPLFFCCILSILLRIPNSEKD
jgi:hypothetical protein